MSARTEPSGSASAAASSSASVPQRKPRFALFIATAGGLGYLPKAPGTWGSAGGALLAILIVWITSIHSLRARDISSPAGFWTVGLIPGYGVCLVAVLIAAVGVWAAGRAARYAGQEDPQFIVIDEVSGQLITYFMPFAVLNWKSWLLGFILFRVFDIWKPFPVRQAEALPGGWGIMADDWVAGIYAGIGLWIARAAGL
jgi:phosphatidylglycerophosphatase A